jgi:hypothetical protein
MWIQGPDGARIVLAGVPAGHPLRRDPRPAMGVCEQTPECRREHRRPPTR